MWYLGRVSTGTQLLKLLGGFCGLLLFMACADKPLVKDLSPPHLKGDPMPLAAGQELVYYERTQPDWALVMTELDCPVQVTIKWDGSDQTQSARLDRENPSLEFAHAGVARVSISAESDGSLGSLSVRGPSATTDAPPSTLEKPNVLLYMVDTLRRDMVGAYGGPPGLTPHWDSFAADSMVYEQMVAASGWTKPSLATIFTGVHPRAHGANSPTAQIRPEFPTLAELLLERGYSTAGFTPNPTADEKFGFARGFQSWSNRYLETSEQIHSRALSWLDQRDASRPFFLFVHSIDPHDPYSPNPEFGARFASDVDVSEYFKVEETPDDKHSALAVKFNRVQQFLLSPALGKPKHAMDLKKLYQAEVAYNDSTFGALVEALKARNLYDSTLIVFISDHGEEFREHGGWLHGGQVIQELVWLPLMVHYPGATIKPGRNSEPVGHLDLFSTILAYSGELRSTMGEILGRPGPNVPCSV
jgi:arylsulfatase A-like enzyme